MRFCMRSVGLRELAEQARRPRKFRIPFPVSWTAILCTLLTSGLAASFLSAENATPSSPVITTAGAVHRLKMADAAARHPVRLRAVVTYYDPAPDPSHTVFFVADDSGGVYVSLARNSPLPLDAGDLVEVTGTSGPGEFAPIVDRATVLKIAPSHLPAVVRQVGLPDLLTGREDSQWVEIKGVVHAVHTTQRHLYLEVKMRDGDISAMTVLRSQGEGQSLAQSLVDATVTVRGVAGTVFNAQGQMTGAHLIFPGIETVHIEEHAPIDPFQSQVETVEGLLHFSSASGLQHRVHVQGTVTLQWPGQRICIADHGHALCAQTDQSAPVNRGDLVDLIGFPAIGAFTPTLVNANYRRADADQRSVRGPSPIVLSAEQALRGNYDAQLISVEATLIGHDRSAAEPTLVLSSGNAVFLAVLPPRYWKQDLDLQEGSLLRVIGICSRQSDGTQLDARSGFPVATAFEILRQSPEDVIVLEAPSWWSAEHTMRVLAFALVLAVAALFGVLVLGHRVKRQTSTIRDSEKRFRHLATHDSLTQIPNRASVLDSLHEAMQEARTNNSSVCIALIDLDHFKQINDTFGHLAGDEVLRESARRLASSIRSTDVIGRYGGEEFLIVFRDMEQENGIARGEIMRHALCKEPIRWQGEDLTITCSVGVASSRLISDSLTALVSVADGAMYSAKSQGRNRVMGAQSMVEEKSNIRFHPPLTASVPN